MNNQTKHKRSVMHITEACTSKPTKSAVCKLKSLSAGQKLSLGDSLPETCYEF